MAIEKRPYSKKKEIITTSLLLKLRGEGGKPAWGKRGGSIVLHEREHYFNRS